MEAQMAPLHAQTTAKPEDGGLLNWEAVLAFGTIQLGNDGPKGPWSLFGESVLQEAVKRLKVFAAFSDLARKHMITLVTEVSKAPAGVVA
eukprot:10838481-Lingulodinium_polyedra.AAC.1